MGATATGKSQLAITLAEAFGGEIVSMDSRQAYRGLDIGTGKVTAAERARVPHHLLDYLAIDENGSAGRHVALAQECMREMASRARVPFAVGGTGLYFRALFGGLVPVTIPHEALMKIRSTFAGRDTRDLYDELARLDPKRAGVLSPADRVRITRALELFAHTALPPTELYRRQGGAPDEFVYLKLVLTMPREALRVRIEARTQELFDAGWVEEVAGLVARGVETQAPGMRSLGYAEIAAALCRNDKLDAVRAAITTLTRQYAKRQETFFRSVENAVWIDMARPGAADRAAALVKEFLDAGAPH